MQFGKYRMISHLENLIKWTVKVIKKKAIGNNKLNFKGYFWQCVTIKGVKRQMLTYDISG